MGLDFSHGNVYFPYHGFQIFRCKLAIEAGIPDLDAMDGYGHGLFPDPKEQLITWDSIPYDPIHLLLDHSDCEGELSSEECQAVAPRLRVLIAPWPDNDRYRIAGYKLAAAMDEAAAANESLEFL